MREDHREVLETEILAIVDRLVTTRVVTQSGRVSWLGPHGYGTNAHPLQIKRLGTHLYHGLLGVLFFLAAADRAFETVDLHDLISEALMPLRESLRQLSSSPQSAERLDLSLGGLLGIGSFVYGLLHLGILLDEEELLDEAVAVTQLISPETIARDQKGRVQTGSAGAILTLLALHRRYPKRNSAGLTPLHLARNCGVHLLAIRKSFEGRPRAWSLSPGKPPVAGFSYGAAGGAYALTRLFEATGESVFLDAAREAWEFISGLYDPRRASWRDIRAIFQAQFEGPVHGTWKDWWASGGELIPRQSHVDEPREEDFSDMWCHGAAGILLGRVAMQATLGERMGKMVEAPLRRLTDQALDMDLVDTHLDDLCCGYMGWVDALHEAGRILARPRCIDAATILALRLNQHAKNRGRFELAAARGRNVLAPSLFQGLAGIGYGFLRLLRPEMVPCVLLLD